MDELDALEPSLDAPRQQRFRAFVESANGVANRSLISQGELEAATYPGRGGGREADAIAAIPANRRAVLEKLRKFFEGPQ